MSASVNRPPTRNSRLLLSKSFSISSKVCVKTPKHSLEVSLGGTVSALLKCLVRLFVTMLNSGNGLGCFQTTQSEVPKLVGTSALAITGTESTRVAMPTVMKGLPFLSTRWGTGPWLQRWTHLTISCRSSESGGSKGRPSLWSSKYLMISSDPTTGWPSCTRVGWEPFGFTLSIFSSKFSNLPNMPMSTSRSLNSATFSAKQHRTFCASRSTLQLW
mmetsp:Transcript_92723/g.286260  ORF Transcript_92723/g.286260 Transcript_92723/m.286260 type:complete len:216 (-) Transcript_92723:257-904(-)